MHARWLGYQPANQPTVAAALSSQCGAGSGCAAVKSRAEKAKTGAPCAHLPKNLPVFEAEAIAAGAQAAHFLVIARRTQGRCSGVCASKALAALRCSAVSARTGMPWWADMSQKACGRRWGAHKQLLSAEHFGQQSGNDGQRRRPASAGLSCTAPARWRSGPGRRATGRPDGRGATRPIARRCGVAGPGPRRRPPCRPAHRRCRRWPARRCHCG